ncbi:rhodanese-like domain-containing protein [Aliifodinibius sp. S!AR15-10]|uniref:MBL fold metallo-hydrolase n=1 Tax=Aliifodinibius sp. S!AR15-10 TaxID=2950437 RepID=UPI00285F388B|nr:rhodanese-like domain-containing protein [Aliifodinibius sp. S!AR15-10]MDR8391672.1 rhodanese-like domain-containing protein [Aliifodinibius sp. S!AR15-10]
MFFKQIFEEKLAQYAYMVGCQASGEAIIIDPMRDIDRYEEFANREGLEIIAAADTHIHADYLTGAREFAEKGVKIYASDEGGDDWRYEWLINSDYNYQLLKDGDRFSIGNIHFEAWHTPGHTPEHLTYKVTDGAAADDPMGLITGDFIFVGDVGRPDLLETAAGQKGVMESSARTLYDSVTEFMRQPEYLQVWPGHGAGSACGKALGAVPESTVGYELRFNPSIKAASSEQNFVDFILEGQPEPPLYFARMKRDNRRGPKLLGKLPQPQHLETEGFIEEGCGEGAVILDTRNRSDFVDGHISGSLSSPLDKNFDTVSGSFIREEERIYLVIEPERLEEAVRALIRIGLDNVEGYITPADLSDYQEKGEPLDHIERTDFGKLQGLINAEDSAVLDVRKATEYEEEHIEGAINIAHTRLLEHLEELPKDKTLLVHCQSGGRASASAALLQRNGYRVKLVDDHINNWPDLVKK